jgi:hypothetical protein
MGSPGAPVGIFLANSVAPAPSPSSPTLAILANAGISMNSVAPINVPVVVAVPHSAPAGASSSVAPLLVGSAPSSSAEVFCAGCGRRRVSHCHLSIIDEII